MKRFTVLLTVFFFLFITPDIFSQEVYTMNCLATADNCEVIPGVEGRWAFEFFGYDTLIINPILNKCYNVKTAVDEDFNYRGRFVNENDVLLLVLSNLEELDPTKYLYAPAHSILKFKLKGDTLSFYSLNYDWFNKKIEDGTLGMDYFTNQGNIYITAPPEKIRTFLIESEDDPELFSDLSYGVRVK